MTERPEQGTGKHPHKDSQEPWPHNERSQSEHRSESRSEHSGGTRQASGSSEGSAQSPNSSAPANETTAMRSA